MNDSVSETVTSEWADKAGQWVLHERIYDAAFAPFTSMVINAADLGPGQRVLDVGCGSGTLLQRIRAAGADAVGVDLSPEMIAAAHRRVPDAHCIQADAQSSNLLAEAPGPRFDRVVSRFGVMFFADPVAAFSNIRASVRPGGQLTFICWREGESLIFTHGLAGLAGRLDRPPQQPADDRPGPMGLASRGHISRVLESSGWSAISIEAVIGRCDFSLDGSDGVEERLSMALAGNVGRSIRGELEAKLGTDGWNLALDQVRAELRAGITGQSNSAQSNSVQSNSVQFDSRAWLVTATA